MNLKTPTGGGNAPSFRAEWGGIEKEWGGAKGSSVTAVAFAGWGGMGNLPSGVLWKKKEWRPEEVGFSWIWSLCREEFFQTGEKVGSLFLLRLMGETE